MPPSANTLTVLKAKTHFPGRPHPLPLKIFGVPTLEWKKLGTRMCLWMHDICPDIRVGNPDMLWALLELEEALDELEEVTSYNEMLWFAKWVARVGKASELPWHYNSADTSRITPDLLQINNSVGEIFYRK